MKETPPPTTRRLFFLDVVRAYACFMMVFGHTVNDLIDPALRKTDLYLNWQHFRGLTAPTFLFVSGFAFYIATVRYWDEYLVWSKKLKHRLWRVFWLLLIGYGLHLPFANPIDFLVSTIHYEKWLSWMNVDILQCVAINLVVLHLAIFLCRTQKRFLVYIAIAMPLLFLLSPLIWNLNGRIDYPRLYSFYLGGNFPNPEKPGEFFSFFPLVPWVGFMYAGILVGHWYRTRLAADAHWHRSLFILGGVVGLFGAALYFPFLALPDSLQFPTLQAQSLWLRLSAVLILFASVCFLVRRIQSLPKVVVILGSETLTVYWMHLVLIYGSAWNAGLTTLFQDRRLSLWSCIGIFAVMFLALTGIVLLKKTIQAWLGKKSRQHRQRLA